MKTTLALGEGAAIVVLAVTLLHGQYLGTALSLLALVVLMCVGTAYDRLTRKDF
jgi:VIT1/CCC1 family predicted Fe2+/Mn2+ transporter